ncbi:MAG: efflux RND transporter periplasmic adaptor subunit [Candidatus Aminicenantales bacterium]
MTDHIGGLPDGARFFVLGVLAFLALSSCRSATGLNEITASGTIEAVEVDVASKASGQVQKILVDLGMPVKEGDILALVDHSTFDIQLRQAEAGVKLAEAQLELLLKGARSEDIYQAEQILRQAEINLKTADEDAGRLRELASKGSATQKQKEDAEARLALAQAQFNSAREALKKIRELARPEEIKAARARLSQANASVDLLKKTIADCTIVSPVRGVVTQKIVEEGELVAQGTTVVTISKLDKVHLIIYVSEKDLGRVTLGQPAEVRIDSYPARVFPGRVIFVSPEAQFTPKNIQTKEDRVKLVFGMKIEIENREGILKAGMPADATLKTDETLAR